MSKARNIADIGSNDVLDTDANGVDVTGNVTADGLNVDSSAYVAAKFERTTVGGGSALQLTNGDDNSWQLISGGDESYALNYLPNGGSTRPYFNVSSGGDIRFYNSAGNSEKFFWDASSESLGIGTTLPDRRLQVRSDENDQFNCTIGLAPSTVDTVQGGIGVRSGGIMGFNAVNTITFGIGGVDGDGASEVARIDSSGHLIAPNGITLGTAVGTYNADNTLDDYEEGTFVPVLSFGGGTTGITYSSQVGIYTKVGRKVTVTINIALTNKGSSTGNAGISMPFTSASIGYEQGHHQPYLPGVTVDGRATHYIGSGTTNSQLVDQNDAGGTAFMVDTNFVNTSIIRSTITYFTA